MKHAWATAKEGTTGLLLGNEAIVRGALEAGVVFTCGYPGTPSSEITDGFASLAPDMPGLYFEYSVNEKVALEMAFAASLAGARSITAMKHLGLTYAGDPLTTIPYIGAVGGMVIVSAGDPSCHTSPNEQDQRHLADMLHIPTLDPSTPQEALEMTRLAFELSEKSQLPVLLRPTTRVCHTRAAVTMGKIGKRQVTGFKPDPKRFVPVPVNARRMRQEIPGRMAIASEILSKTDFFHRRGPEGVSKAVLATGAPSAAAGDVLSTSDFADDVAFLHLGIVHPLPDTALVDALKGIETLLIIEELSPFLEDAVRALCSLHKLTTEVLGKRTGHFPTEFEYGPNVIREGLDRAFGAGLVTTERVVPAAPTQTAPPRPPVLCASCGHRSTFFAARSVFGSDAFFFNDIGCYTLGMAAPLSSADALLCMGAGFAMAAGVSRVTGERTVGFLGDSTFFHSGMPALLNLLKEDANVVAVILDNEVTAMTGFQESPFIDVGTEGAHRTVDIEGVVRALGAKQVDTVDPNDLAAISEVFERARKATGPSVVIAKRPCAVNHTRLVRLSKKKSTAPSTYVIDHSRCQHCGRDDGGQRCSVKPTVEYSRAMARSRSLEVKRSLPMAPEPVAACATACPLHLCVQGYTASIAAGEYGDALEQIMSRLPLPDSVCRVCERPCESACVRADVDEPVAINDLKRFVVNWANEEQASGKPFPYQPERQEDHKASVAVVGAGPAGLAAAHELRLRGYTVTLYDANKEAGGLLLTGIPRYRLPIDALRRDVARVLELGVRFEGNRRLGTDLHLHELLDAHSAVYLAIGAEKPRDLKLDGAPMIHALDYLRQSRDSATANSGQQVLIIGGGNSAVDAARTAMRTGAKRVVVACLESQEEMPAIAEEVAEAAEEGVEFLTRMRATAWNGSGVKLEGVVPREAGNFSPDNFAAVPDTEVVVEAQQVVVAIGQAIAEGFLGDADPKLETKPNGGLVSNSETCASSDPRVFVGGDFGSSHTVTDAIADGLRAAWGIDSLVRGKDEADKRLPPPRAEIAPRQHTKVERTDVGQRQVPVMLDAAERVTGFAEVTSVLSEQAAKEEARRCMICGQCGNCRACLDTFGCPAFRTSEGKIVIDEELCTACGVCADFCPNGAIVPKGIQS